MTVNLAVLSTEYALLVYVFSNTKWKDTHYVFCGRISKETIESMKKVGAQNILSGEHWEELITELRKERKSTLRYQWLRLEKELMRVVMQVKVVFFCFLHHKDICTFAQTDNPISRCCHAYFFNLVEDGILNYENHDFMKFASNKFVKHVYLTGRLPTPIEFKDKIIFVDMKKRWKEFSAQKKQEIVDLFHFDYDKLLHLVTNGRDKILLTQNFYRYGRCTVEEQVQIYREILSNYDMKEIIIKPHPEDEIDYKKYFPKCYLLKDKFPFELCFFTNLPLKKLISVNSTSTYGLWDEKYVERHEEMLERLKDLS